MSLEVQKKIPNLKWYQSENEVYFSILIHNFNKDNIKINKNNFSLENSDYKISFDFFDEINDEDIEYKKFEKYLSVSLKKINEGFWKYLVKNNLYKNNVKVDWDRWYDEDMEDDEPEMDFGNMMGGMPGMEGMMGGMPGMEDMMGGMPGMEDMEDMEGMEDNENSNVEECCNENNKCSNEECCDENNKCSNEECCENIIEK